MHQNIDEKKAISILIRNAKTKKDFEKVLSHSRKVAKVALEISKDIPEVDRDFILTASLLHDVGRFDCPPWKNSVCHGIVGAKILRELKLYKHALVAERHLGAGITREDIIGQKLPIPAKYYLPKTREEKIITVADKLVSGSRRITISTAVERFKSEIGDKIAQRVHDLYIEVMGLKSGHRKIKRRAKESLKKGSLKG